jgi:hypothetical protein
VAIGYRLDKTLGLTVVVWDGAVTGDDAEDHVRRLVDDPDWPPGPNHLLDTTTAASIPNVANTKLVEMLVDAAHGRAVRFALVASDGFSEATRFQRAALAGGVLHVVVFGDVATACTWLGTDRTKVRSALGTLRRELRKSRLNEAPESD